MLIIDFMVIKKKGNQGHIIFIFSSSLPAFISKLSSVSKSNHHHHHRSTSPPSTAPPFFFPHLFLLLHHLFPLSSISIASTIFIIGFTPFAGLLSSVPSWSSSSSSATSSTSLLHAVSASVTCCHSGDCHLHYRSSSYSAVKLLQVTRKLNFLFQALKLSSAAVSPSVPWASILHSIGSQWAQVKWGMSLGN